MSEQFNDFNKLSDQELEKCVRTRLRYSPQDVEAAIAELEKRGRIFSFAELREIEKDLQLARREKPGSGNSTGNGSGNSFGNGFGFGKSSDSGNSADSRNSVGNSSGNSSGSGSGARNSSGWGSFGFGASKESESSNGSIFDSREEKGFETQGPSYYSPVAVSIVSILFSTVFGVVLMAINFSKAQNKRGMWEVIGFGIIYLIAVSILKTYLPHVIIGKEPSMKELGTIFFFALATNSIGALILYQFFWKKYIGDKAIYRSKPVLTQIVIIFMIGLLIAGILTRMGISSI